MGHPNVALQIRNDRVSVMKIHEQLIAPTLGLAVRKKPSKNHQVQTHLFGLCKVSANCQQSDAN
jgi:hypothetical protein